MYADETGECIPMKLSKAIDIAEKMLHQGVISKNLKKEELLLQCQKVDVAHSQPSPYFF